MLKRWSMINISPEVMGGTPVFLGTRVPVATFLDYVQAGESIAGEFSRRIPHR